MEDNNKFNLFNINSNNCNNTPVIFIITYNNVDINKCTIFKKNVSKNSID